MARVRIDDLNKVLSARLKESEDRSAKFIREFVSSIRGALTSGKDVPLAGFGEFLLATADGTAIPSASKADLMVDLTTRLPEPRAKIESMMSTLVEAIKAELLNGRTVELDGFGAFEVKFEKAKIEKQAKGHKLIRPATTSLRFSCAKPIGLGRAAFSPSDSFKKKVEQFRPSTVLLVVPDHDYFTKTIEFYFKNAGWDIETITSVKAAADRIASGKAFLVIQDSSMADHQQFCRGLKFSPETAKTPLIMLWPNEDAYKAIKEVSVVGDENLPEPFEFRRLLDFADSEILRAAEEELIFRQQFSIQLPADEQSVEKVIEQVNKAVRQGGIAEEVQVAFSAAFREAVVNAAQHGNNHDPDKKIEVLYLLDSEKITSVVKDQGQGFDHAKYVKAGAQRDAASAARERHAQGGVGGLGIMLMLKCCDKVEYNQKGNQITLTKYLKGAPPKG
jgi:anti-sigma regulatory factor (Ser/Thr protein kinase)/nucleoid DNA-binding protein